MKDLQVLSDVVSFAPTHFTPNRHICEQIAEIGAWTPVCITIRDLMLAGF